MKTQMRTFCLALCLSFPVILTGVTGCAGNRYERSTGEYIDDKALTGRVKGALNDNKEYKFSGVDVKTFRGTVQLSGWVNTSDQKKKAGQIAQNVQGVKNVENNLLVKAI
jgi:hyperosmotically inducible periplasmic protein